MSAFISPDFFRKKQCPLKHKNYEAHRKVHDKNRPKASSLSLESKSKFPQLTLSNGVYAQYAIFVYRELNDIPEFCLLTISGNSRKSHFRPYDKIIHKKLSKRNTGEISNWTNIQQNAGLAIFQGHPTRIQFKTT